jgi:two component transcriptional regulator, winged helix family
MATKDIFESRIKFKEIYEYDMKSKQLFKNGEEVQMPKNEAKLFFLLVSNIEKVVSYKVIENYVWGEKSMSNEALRMTIKKIRAKTDADLIKNISGMGYRLSGSNQI